MSRIGKRPILIPNKVTIEINGQYVAAKGPKGSLDLTLSEKIKVFQESDTLVIERADNSRTAKERHGLSRTLIANMVEGVFKGFEKRLSIQGVGYRAQTQGSKIILNVGYSKPVEMIVPQGIQVVVENNTQVVVSGIDKEIVGNVAAQIRAVRPPEVYKGKGIRYLGEFVRRKAGKAGKAGKK
ncbi:50S ribosomal protein L6 [cyanobacterium endosymbiont of Epithemia turgida]|uniref:50S ribosomal protein L6 n=1 Tax=cyanobacterium endosymbiont of Epithemia turgida TaxID=718217 RepID=UPI0004D1B392|nr:50S ribosomal protein L6 [cyanobacterium endosymbiont of Epithemia turgida]BAP17359.1 50S ribosomal protein L6 [cyanobacterium endosymbiont of Epithemia turgida isolate EtSB Lake Yunoko]